MSRLYDDIIKEFGAKPLRQMQIPSHISENLSKELREYQKNAIKNYLANNETLKKNHLMFNMATGSGKTLVMACLMLDAYKNGYRNFVFFVNSTAILEKTKANFCDSSSPKYLFASEVNIDGKRVEIKSVNNFDESDENAINIYFSTVQGLFSLFKDEKENSLTLQDLQNYEIVFLADEAHHLNSETKKKLTQSEENDKEGWESIIKKAFKSHENNLMLEFTATIPNDKNVLAKYEDKVIYEYALREFCTDGFSKRIFLVRYDDTNLKIRLLGACLLSSYREFLARENDIQLKPVILFKSETVNLSKENQRLFNEILQDLNGNDISEFYKNVDKNDELFKYSIEFFKKIFGDTYANTLAKHIKVAFKDTYQLNANDDKDANANQIKLNTLEDIDNNIRVIFAVDKLNEGWDVLNLFDIVRLGSAVAKSTAKTTTKEAQLIGRGARYFPFGEGENKYKRKYDNELFKELTMLERLSYHALNDVEYIKNIRKELKEQGVLFGDKQGVIELNPSKKAKKITNENDIFYVSNKKIPLNKKSIFNADKIKRDLECLEIDYIGHKISNNEEKFDNTTEENINYKKSIVIGENIEYQIFQKAMNILKINIDDIKAYNKTITSKREFYNRVLAPLRLLFHRRQNFSDPIIKLDIAKYILSNYKNFLNKESRDYEITDFTAKRLMDTGIRKIIKDAKYGSDNDFVFDRVENSPYEWLYYDKFSTDSELEKEFIDFIEANKDKIDDKFSEWIIMRNEGFEEFKIYDNRKNSPTYAEGFEPDFIFFGKPKESAKLDYLSAEVIMESKGLHLYKAKDNWKEDLILDNSILNNKIFKTTQEIDTQIELNVYAMPFFFGRKNNANKENNKRFEYEFNKFFLTL